MQQIWHRRCWLLQILQELDVYRHHAKQTRLILYCFTIRNTLYAQRNSRNVLLQLALSCDKYVYDLYGEIA